MHDDLLERRLRAALHDEADGLSFTVTAEELERRIALRGRLSAGRRTTLLLAATLGIGLLGFGAFIGGLADDSSPTPEPSAAAVDATAPAPSAPTQLGDLDDWIDVAIGDEVVVAQAREHVDIGGTVPSGTLPDQASMRLGTITGSTRYQLALACLGGGSVELDIRVPSSRGPRTGPHVVCDGALYTQQISADGPREVGLFAPRLASWRIVIRRLEGDGPGPATEPAPLGSMPEMEELVRQEGRSIVSGDRPWGDSGLYLEEVGSVASRWNYSTRVSCSDGESIRLIFGHDFEEGRFAATTETVTPCDGQLHEVGLGIPYPSGSEIAVAASPGTRWSVLVAGEQPPVSIAEGRPGWQRQVGFGPHLTFDGSEHGFSAPGVDGGGPVLVVIACAGPTPIDVVVDVGARVGDRQQTMTAACTTGGAETGQTFDLEASYVDLTFAAPVGSWVAVTILVPDPLPE